MQNQHQEYWFNLIMDHLTGSATDEARRQLTGWRSASGENERLFVEMQKMWDALSLSKRNEQFDEQRAYRMFRERVNTEPRMAKRIPMSRRQLFRKIASYAAIVIPFVILSYFAGRYFTSASGQKGELTLLEVAVPNGSKTQMKLQDGSMVWLNAGSKLQYDSEFGRTNRKLVLSGEAYFEVTKNEETPFIVETGEVKVKVLGTHFNVTAYSENSEIKVALLEGAVEMTPDKSNTVFLKPGDLVYYYTTTRQTVISPSSTDHALDWRENRLIFTGETFEQITRTLERNFDVKVSIHNRQIKTRQFAGDFVNNETIEQILHVMSVNGKFRYQIKGNVVDIY